MKLQYKAAAKDGVLSKGLIEAKDKDEAAGILRARGMLPVEISSATDDSVTKYFPFLNSIKNKDVVLFTSQLASMLSSGLTLLQALNILRDQMQNPRMQQVVIAIITDIQGGSPLSAAIAKFPDIFTPIYISLVRTAESSGLLDKVLTRLADNLEKQEKLHSAIKGALTYPIIVVIGMVAVMFVMMIFVIPQLTVLYGNLGIPLPTPTLIIVKISEFVKAFWFLIIGLFVVMYIAINRWHNTPSGKVVLDTVVLRLPVFGKLVSQSILTEFTRTFGLLVSSGSLIVQSLQEASDVAGNVIYKDAILDIAKKVEKGVSIGDAIATYAIFPPVLIQMVKIGEDTGKLDESLLKVSEYFEREVDQSVKTLTTSLEPMIMVVLGIGVAFLIVSIITPIYNLTNSLQ